MIDDIPKKIKYDEIVCWDKEIPDDCKDSFKAMREYLKKYNTVFIGNGGGQFADEPNNPEDVSDEEKSWGIYRLIDGKYYSRNTWHDVTVWISDAKATHPTISVWNLNEQMEFFDRMVWVSAQAIKNVCKERDDAELSNDKSFVFRASLNKREYFQGYAEDLAEYFLDPAMNDFNNFCIEGDYLTRDNAIKGIKEWLQAYFPEWADKTNVEFVPEWLEKKQELWYAKRMLEYIQDGLADYDDINDEKQYGWHAKKIKEHEESGGGEIEDKPFEKFLEAYKR